MKNWPYILLLSTHSLLASDPSIFTNEFIEYHLKTAIKAIEDEDVFDLIQINVDNLKDRGV